MIIKIKPDISIFGQNSATPVIVGRGPAELREAKKTAVAQTSQKTTSCSLEVNEYTNLQSQKYNKQPKSDLLRVF